MLAGRQRVKRGGQCNIVSWDEQSAENRYLLEPRDEATPEKLFEQSWALTVIGRSKVSVDITKPRSREHRFIGEWDDGAARTLVSAKSFPSVLTQRHGSSA